VQAGGDGSAEDISPAKSLDLDNDGHKTGEGDETSLTDTPLKPSEALDQLTGPTNPVPGATSHRQSWRTAAPVAGVVLVVAMAVLGTYAVMHREVQRAAMRGPLAKSAGYPTSASASAPRPVRPADSAAAAAPIIGPRVALVIGNNKYRYVGQLTNPRNDARLMAQSLKRVGFTLVGDDAQLDLDKGGLEHVLEQFSEQLQGASVALFYYAGHGLQLGGENYLVPTSANPQRESDVKLQMVDAQVILDQMQDAGARLNILILDACRNNPFAGRGLRALGGGLAQMQAPEGTLISYATQPGAVASDGQGADSPYTTALAEVMLEPGLRLFDTFNAVGNKVKDVTRNSQVPWMSASAISGDFYFTGTPAPAAMPTQAVAKSTSSTGEAEIVFWQSIQSSRNPRDFTAYLKQYPGGQFAPIAQNRLSELSDNPAASPTAGMAAQVIASQPPRLPNPSPSARPAEQVAARETPSVAAPVPDRSLSQNLSDYLHHNRLPYVEALVLSDENGAARSLVLSGRVRTEMGKRDAELKSRDFLGSTNVRIRNRIKLDPELARGTSVESQGTEPRPLPSPNYGNGSENPPPVATAAPPPELTGAVAAGLSAAVGAALGSAVGQALGGSSGGSSPVFVPVPYAPSYGARSPSIPSSSSSRRLLRPSPYSPRRVNRSHPNP